MRGSPVQRLIVFSLLASCMAGPASLATTGIALAPGDKAPALIGVDLDGGKGRALDWQAQRFTLVNFWATWCVPCQQEMPALQQLHERYRAQGLQLVGVHWQEIANTEIKLFVDTWGVTYSILRASPKTSKEWGGISALPASFLIDRKGTILRRYVGATPEQTAGLVADMEAVMAGRPLPPMVIPAPATPLPTGTAP